MDRFLVNHWHYKFALLQSWPLGSQLKMVNCFLFGHCLSFGFLFLFKPGTSLSLSLRRSNGGAILLFRLNCSASMEDWFSWTFPPGSRWIYCLTSKGSIFFLGGGNSVGRSFLVGKSCDVFWSIEESTVFFSFWAKYTFWWN